MKTGLLNQIYLPCDYLDSISPICTDITGNLNGIQGKRGVPIVHLDLFSGTGGFALGLKQAGFKFKRHYFSEVDKHAIANYQYRFPSAEAVGDVSILNGKSIERPDIITFGSPCQDISIAGKRKGLGGSRSRLFFEAVRLIRECKPSAFIFENVKGIFSSNQGKDFEKVLQIFADIGLYDCQWQMLNTRWFLPQNRERLYFVGTLRKESRCQIFPFRPGSQKTVKRNKQNWKRQVSPCITTTVGDLTNHAPYVLHVPEATIKGFASAHEGDSVNLSYLKANSRRGRVGKGIANTIETTNQQFTIVKGRLRRLTPLDCERLQGFSDGWTELGKYEAETLRISDSQRYKLLGNAVSVPVVKEIGKRLLCLFKHAGKKMLRVIDQLNGYSRQMQESNEYIGITSNNFVNAVLKSFKDGVQYNKRSIEKLAGSFGITDKTLVKELTELAIVIRARELAHQPGSVKERFDSIVNLYNAQVNLSHRTSQSILLQQYSTPAPIAYLAGVFCGLDKLQFTGGFAFEPSAGNGLLTIAAKTERVFVNEIDVIRNNNLRKQGFNEVTQRDATQAFIGYRKRFDAVLTNPPFGVMEKPVMYESFSIKPLEHVMALRALDCMNDEGKAAIIIGGHTHWDEKGRIQAGKNRIFFNYLYSRYNVMEVINIDGHKLYSRQGTSFDVRLILIDSRKKTRSGNAPLHDGRKDVVVNSFDELFNRVTDAMKDIPVTSKMDSMKRLQLRAKALALELDLLKINDLDGLDAPYEPASQACIVLNTQVPDSMAFETHSAVQFIRKEVGGDMDNFVRHRLCYPTKAALCKVLSAEQIDAVGMAIYNIEARGQGIVIGDQTGIGKGRVAAAMIRYGVVQGLRPVFLTEKANLFSDIYRDLSAIGSAHFKPFIVNGREPKTDIKDEDGNVVYQAPEPTEQKSILESRELPSSYDFVVGTYSQFNSAEKKPVKPNFLLSLAENNLFIMDEAHNSSGSSNTGSFMQGAISQTKGVVFLSATFAKRPDNMPIYAMKTAISDCNMTKDDLVESITKGGVALQEVLASQLVAEGQMIRRERSFEGVEVNYINLDDKSQEHKAIADNITEILRDIIAFQKSFVDKEVEDLDKIAAAEAKEVGVREGTSQAGVDNTPYFSKVFNVINQMLFSLKAEAVAEKAIERRKEGKKPVIAFASTMGSFIETMETDTGLPVGDGDTINADFSGVLQKGLDGIMRYTERGIDGKPEYKKFDISDFSPEAQLEYSRIVERIRIVSTGITVSPIDIIIKKLKEAGYTVEEVTGRKFELQLPAKGTKALVLARKRINTNDAFRQFNNNEVDILMINQSGSTGASAHAIPTTKVSVDQVQQRVMIVLQAELDISTEVQKRGRINRTGQILKPIYDYVSSAIPAEKRLMMMLQKKLKSLDANTTSNQKQSSKILDVPDFLNKYGDKIVKEYLSDNPEVNLLLDDPLNILESSADSGSGPVIEGAAMKVSGRVAVLSTQMQEDFYNDITERYNDYVEYLKQVGDYDLEVEVMNLEAATTSSRVIKMGKGTDSAFGDDSSLETVKANVLKKPFTKTELENLLNESLKGADPKELQQEFLQEYTSETQKKLDEGLNEIEAKYTELIKNIPNEKNIKKLESDPQSWNAAIQERQIELKAAKLSQIDKQRAQYNNRKQAMQSYLKFFYVGKYVHYPVESFGTEKETVPAVFLGYILDRKKKNPYTASAIKFRFAIAGGNKYIAIPASYSQEIREIMGASVGLKEAIIPELLDAWEKFIKERSQDRTIRYIITGNLLQAFSDYKGKLVSYTTVDKQEKKGILLPEYWNPKEQVQENVVVPIGKALPIIRSLVGNNQIVTNNGLSFFKKGDYFKIVIASSRSRGGDIYLDKDILALVEGNNFEKVSDKMVATLPEENIQNLIEVLQKNHSLSITIQSHQLKEIEKQVLRANTRKPILLPEIVEEKPEPNEQKGGKLRLLRLRAKALSLDLELLAA